MRRRPGPLLCELHAHTTWSDGELGVRGLVDLYGRAGFDVLAVTDHVYPPGTERGVEAATWVSYVRDVDAEAARALALYDMLVLPGLELTWNEPDAGRSAHAVCVGVRGYVGLARGLDAALDAATTDGAAVIAAHPYAVGDPRSTRRGTERWHADESLRPRAHRFELFNRHDAFPWVTDERLPTVASGDFHRPEHLATWKTLLPCAKRAGAVISYLRSARPAYLVRVEPTADELAA